MGADQTSTLTLPIDLALANLGGAAMDALRKKEKVKARVVAGLKVGTPWGDIPLDIDETEELNIS